MSRGVKFTGPLKIRKDDGTLVTVIDEDGNIDAPVTTANPVFTGAATTTIVDVVGTGTTTGIGVDVTGNTALTTGQLISISSSATAIATTGRLFLSTHSGVSGTSAILNEFVSAAADETVITQVTASAALAAGTAFKVSAAAMTTGTAIGATDLDALTTGKGVHIASAATAIATTGRMFLSAHTGATGTSAVLNEFSSAATDETTVVKVTASAALAAGVAVDISAAAMTTGIALDMSDLDALTTGTGIKLYSNSADATARVLLDIKNDHASAAGTIPMRIVQDAVTSTNFRLVAQFSGINLYISDQTSPNTALTAPEGSICLNGSGTGQAFWNTDGATAWTALA